MVTQRADEDALLFLHNSNIISAHFSVNTSFFLNSCCNLVEFKWLAATEVNKIHQYRPAEACASILFKPYKSPRPLLFCNNQEGKSFILDFFLKIITYFPGAAKLFTFFFCCILSRIAIKSFIDILSPCDCVRFSQLKLKSSYNSNLINMKQ